MVLISHIIKYTIFLARIRHNQIQFFNNGRVFQLLLGVFLHIIKIMDSQNSNKSKSFLVNSHAAKQTDHINSLQSSNNVSVTQHNLSNKVSTQDKCPIHKSELTLLNINTHTKQCPKCVVFCQDEHKFKDVVFVELEHNIEKVMQQKFNTVQKKIKKIKQSTMNIVQVQRQKTQKNLNGKIHEKYCQLLQELNKNKFIEENKIRSKIDRIWDNFWKEPLEQFVKFEEKFLEMVKSVSNCEGEERRKIEAISNAVKMSNNIQSLHSNMEIQGELVVGSLKKYTNEYKCRLRQAQDCKFNLSLVKKCSEDESRERFQRQLDSEQLLISVIENEQFEQSQKKEQEHTMQNSLNFSMSMSMSMSQINKSFQPISTQRPNMTVLQKSNSKKMTPKSSLNSSLTQSSKTLLTLKSLNSNNKIQTQVREIDAKNLSLSNLDAKKLLTTVSKTFVKSLDLSNNKLNNFFLKDLNKTQIGKYLKTIKLSGNNIDIKEPTICKKIEQLKGLGVKIII